MISNIYFLYGSYCVWAYHTEYHIVLKHNNHRNTISNITEYLSESVYSSADNHTPDAESTTLVWTCKIVI